MNESDVILLTILKKLVQETNLNKGLNTRVQNLEDRVKSLESIIKELKNNQISHENI